ncbi:Rhodanese-related sulfurtransferase-like [Desulfuromonas acetoxidans DSM 684]|uniref:Rhodanese-related sulfurtransferase-like n=2 Tax=Desulfuromonas acetoxidans TaxID=891 RepID=Q1JXU5_DESA6|nr:Rhodanese-related sulfurtransferase-like [Desulfuromonas acetoxidans DSM 684]
MSKRARPKISNLYALCACLISMLLLWGCGSGGSSDSYTDIDAEYYKNDATASALLEPETLISWVNAGYRTESGKRVVILDCVPNPAGVYPYSDVEAWFAGDADKIKTNMAAQYGSTGAPQYLMIDTLNAAGLLGHIPGALPSVSHEGYEVTARDDGPMLADHQIGTGSLIDQMIQRFGIQKDDVVVLTTSRYDYPGFCSSRLWWTLRYWGFAKDNLKVLNGGNKAYKMAGGTLEQGIVTLANVTPSTFSVTDLAQRFTDMRTSIGDLIDMVDSGATTNGEVIVLDARQPPTPFYFTDVLDETGAAVAGGNGVGDIYEVPGYTYDASTGAFTNPDGVTLNLSQMLFNDPHLATQRIPSFSMSTPLPFDVATASPWIRFHWRDDADPSQGAVILPIAAKPAGFDGIIRGAKLVKNGGPAWNVTIPVVTNATTNTKYASKDTLIAAFAAAGIDGTKPIVTYCNSGALASIYYFILKEICEFPNVTMYDGSWQEWGNLTAYEPTDTTFIRNDPTTVFPSYPAGIPSAAIFKGKNDYLEWDATDGFTAAIDETLTADDHITTGGSLSGNAAWDTVHRSEHVIFRATADLNDDLHSYTDGVDWPDTTTYPDYLGFGDEIQDEDDSYAGSSSSTGDDEGPTAFVPSGGGC